MILMQIKQVLDRQPESAPPPGCAGRFDATTGRTGAEPECQNPGCWLMPAFTLHFDNSMPQLNTVRQGQGPLVVLSHALGCDLAM